MFIRVCLNKNKKDKKVSIKIIKKEEQENQSIITHNGILDEFKEFEQSIKLFTDIRTIVIPKHTEEQLRMKRFEKELLKVHKDKNLAIEYCLVFLSNFAHIHFA